MTLPKSQAALSRKICFDTESAMNSSEKSVLLCLSMHGDAFGMNIHPSYSTIAKECRLSDRTVKTTIKSLIQKEFIVKKDSGGIINKKHISNNYYIDIRLFGFTYPNGKR